MSSRHDLDKVSPWHFKPRFFQKHSEKVAGSDLEYMKDVREALMAQSTPSSSAMLYLMTLITVSVFIWAALFEVDEVTQAEARVINKAREQVVNSLEGGLLAELLVSEGQYVEKGEPLIKLEPTRAESQYDELIQKELGLKAARARAQAEALGTAIKFPAEVVARKNIMLNEKQVYEAKRKLLEESVSGLKNSLEIIQNEIRISDKLAQRGLYSQVELSRLKRQENDLNIQMSEKINRYRADANNELTKIDGELTVLLPNIRARRDNFKRTTLTAPVKGVVKNIRSTTIGSAVPPSAPLMDIVPLDANLLFEARLDPKDISFVAPDLPVALKLTAYDSAIFGELSGTVKLISPDTFRDDAKPTEAAQGGYYRVLIESTIDTANPKQKTMKIVPGMIATAQIKTGKKTILRYLTKPLLKANEAFRER